MPSIRPITGGAAHTSASMKLNRLFQDSRSTVSRFAVAKLSIAITSSPRARMAAHK